MQETKAHSVDSLASILEQIVSLQKLLTDADAEGLQEVSSDSIVKRFVKDSSRLIQSLHQWRGVLASEQYGPVAISLGRSDGIAKFFAFSFVHQQMRDLADLSQMPFFGSGVYAIYYRGPRAGVYAPLAGTETPIYVGKANPTDPYAETLEAQGPTIYKRLKDHAKSIGNTELPIEGFGFRYAAIQSGMQAAVEDFMIRLFRPVWNKETKICYGIGKHGDNPVTRTNKRSPWDTMHPGRHWAKHTKANQMERDAIVKKIVDHFIRYPVIANKAELFKMLSLG